MRWLAALAVLGCAIMLGLACGGAAFEVVAGGDAGPDATTTESGSPPGPEASSDAGSPEGSTQDVQTIDVLEEPPASCTGSFACVPAIPSGWMGPLEVYADAGAAPACSQSFAAPQDAYDQLAEVAATCGCLCGGGSVQCAAPPTTFYSYTTVSGCAAQPCGSTPLTPSTCTTVDDTVKCGALVAMTSPQAVVLDAGCPAQSTMTIPPVSWGTNARACTSTVATAQLDCTSGSICAPRSQAPFAASLCIGSTGDMPCPAGGYTSRHVYYDGALDTRGCSACSCTAQNFACSSTIEVWGASSAACSGMGDEYVGAVTCEVIAQPADVELTISPLLGTCTPSQGMATGTELAAKPFTVCCAP